MKTLISLALVASLGLFGACSINPHSMDMTQAVQSARTPGDHENLAKHYQDSAKDMQAKVDELSRASNDMKNLLDSTDIATLFLDKDLNVRRFTTQATKIIKLIPADVGRPSRSKVSWNGHPPAENSRSHHRTGTFPGTATSRWQRKGP
jgi:hypothetical protein